MWCRWVGCSEQGVDGSNGMAVSCPTLVLFDHYLLWLSLTQAQHPLASAQSTIKQTCRDLGELEVWCRFLIRALDAVFCNALRQRLIKSSLKIKLTWLYLNTLSQKLHSYTNTNRCVPLFLSIPDTLWFVHICPLLISAPGRGTAIADCLLFALSVPGDLFLLFYCVASLPVSAINQALCQHRRQMVTLMGSWD